MSLVEREPMHKQRGIPSNPVTVTITGETASGKTVIAAAITKALRDLGITKITNTTDINSFGFNEKHKQYIEEIVESLDNGNKLDEVHVLIKEITS